MSPPTVRDDTVKDDTSSERQGSVYLQEHKVVENWRSLAVPLKVHTFPLVQSGYM